MSLEQAAKHLAAHGRGKDTALVHMTPSEVQSLQTLAMANGGSLSINPHTGLPEAGFLSSMLPMIAGAALVAATGGAAAPAVLGGMSMPMAAGLGIGALQTARTGSLQKGLMAGLGAYGGAGLAGGLMATGAGAMGDAAASQAFDESIKNQGLNAAEIGRDISNPLAEKAAFAARDPINVANMSVGDRFSAMGKGIGSLGQSGGFTNLGNAMTASGGPGLGRAAISAAAPMLLGGEQQQQAPAGDSTMPQRLQYNVGRAKDAQGNTFTPMPDVPGYDDLGRDFGRPQSYFPNAGYQQITQEEAKKMRGYAGGGPVEDMSNANAIGANTGYPMANINKATYATPYQTPISQNVVQGTADTGVNSMTGEMNEFAAGGNVQLQGRVTMDEQGGGQGGGANGYQAAGSGSGQGQQNSLGITQQPQGGQFGQASANGYQPMGSQGGMMGGLNQRDIAANPQGLQQLVQGAQQQAQPKASAASFSLLRPEFDAFRNAPKNPAAMMAAGGLSAAYAAGGMSHLGDYSDGGRLLKGPGDGVSDSIPATIGNKRPARLADGEFVVPARIVSELGNGSTEAGARKLYAMLDRVQAARKKSIGKGKVAHNSRADKLLPA